MLLPLKSYFDPDYHQTFKSVQFELSNGKIKLDFAYCEYLFLDSNLTLTIFQ